MVKLIPKHISNILWQIVPHVHGDVQYMTGNKIPITR